MLLYAPLLPSPKPCQVEAAFEFLTRSDCYHRACANHPQRSKGVAHKQRHPECPRSLLVCWVMFGRASDVSVEHDVCWMSGFQSVRSRTGLEALSRPVLQLQACVRVGHSHFPGSHQVAGLPPQLEAEERLSYKVLSSPLWRDCRPRRTDFPSNPPSQAVSGPLLLLAFIHTDGHLPEGPQRGDPGCRKSLLSEVAFSEKTKAVPMSALLSEGPRVAFNSLSL